MQTIDDEVSIFTNARGRTELERSCSGMTSWWTAAAGAGWLLLVAVAGAGLWLSALVVSATVFHDALISLPAAEQRFIFVSMLLALPVTPGLTAGAVHLVQGQRLMAIASVIGALISFAFIRAIYAHL